MEEEQLNNPESEELGDLSAYFTEFDNENGSTPVEAGERQANELISMGFHHFLQYLLLNSVSIKQPELEGLTHSEILLKFVDDPSFFDSFLYSHNPLIKNFREELYREEGNLIRVIEQLGADSQKKNWFKLFLLSQFNEIADITGDGALAKALGTENRVSDIKGELIARRIIDDNFPGLKDFITLDTIRELRRELANLRNARERKPNPFSGYGKVYENLIGVLLAVNCPAAAEHQLKLPSYNGSAFRVVDYGLNGASESSNDSGGIVEVKTGQKLSAHDINQIEDFLRAGMNLTYIVPNTYGELANSLRQRYPQVMVISHIDLLNNNEMMKAHPLIGNLENAENFKNLKESINTKRLERDLFSIYLFLKENPQYSQFTPDLLNVALSQDEEEYGQINSFIPIKWLTPREYQLEQASYLDGSSYQRLDASEEIIRRLNERIKREKQARRAA